MFVNRNKVKIIKDMLSEREYIALVGPRQCGKTTLLKKIVEEHGNANYLSFENIETRRLFLEQPDEFYHRHLQDVDLLVIDEFQYGQKTGQPLKYIFDTYGKKIIISGSSALKIKTGIGASMVGRLVFVELSTFDFEEYLASQNNAAHRVYTAQPHIMHKEMYAKNNLAAELRNHALSGVLYEEQKKHFDTFLITGGYPRVALANNNHIREQMFASIIDNYLLRDIQGTFSISKIHHYQTLLELLTPLLGHELNYTRLSDAGNLSFADLKEYLHILTETFITHRLRPFYKNKSSEITKNPKLYWYDTGLRNYIMKNMNTPALRNDAGALFENYVWRTLHTHMSGIHEAKYWRTKTGAEVDFVWEKNGRYYCIEAKYKTMRNPIVGKSLYSFIAKYNPARVFIINLSYFHTQMIKNTEIIWLPFYML
jgi:predicted AAA+ superfamily ATPase